MKKGQRKSSDFTQSTKDTNIKCNSNINRLKTNKETISSSINKLCNTNKKVNLKRKYFLEELDENLQYFNLTNYKKQCKCKINYSDETYFPSNIKAEFKTIKRKLIFNEEEDDNSIYSVNYHNNDNFSKLTSGLLEQNTSNNKINKKDYRFNSINSKLKSHNENINNHKNKKSFSLYEYLESFEFSNKLTDNGENKNSLVFVKSETNKSIEELKKRQSILYHELNKFQINSEIYVEKSKYFAENLSEVNLSIENNKKNFPTCFSTSSIVESSDNQSLNLSKNNSSNLNTKSLNENAKNKKNKNKDLKYVWKTDSIGYIYLNDRSFVRYPNKNKFDLISSLYSPFK